ncbi:MAG: AI-2E family transporter [Thermodesulfobacteriota bacterium]
MSQEPVRDRDPGIEKHDAHAAGEARSALGLHTLALLALLLFGLWQALRIFSPFVHTFILAAVLAAIFHPVQARLVERLGRSQPVASVMVLGVVVFCVALPTAVFLGGLATQGVQSVARLNQWLSGANLSDLVHQSSLQSALDWARGRFPGLVLTEAEIQSNILSLSRRMGQELLTFGTHFLGNAVYILFHFLLMLFILFFLLKDGRHWLDTLRRLTPLRRHQEDAIIDSLRKVSRAVLVGGLLVALLQGLVGGVGLALVGIPGLFWGTMMGFASLIPVVGTGLIWIPATAWLLVEGNWQGAVFLLLWSGLLVTSIDTFLRPYFMRGASGVSTLFIFLAVIGGLQTFGALGILYGPLILSFTMAMINIYSEEYQERLTREKECLPNRPAKG